MGAAPQISPARGSGGKKLARMSVTGVRAFLFLNGKCSAGVNQRVAMCLMRTFQVVS